MYESSGGLLNLKGQCYENLNRFFLLKRLYLGPIYDHAITVLRIFSFLRRYLIAKFDIHYFLPYLGAPYVHTFKILLLDCKHTQVHFLLDCSFKDIERPTKLTLVVLV